jgi:serine/threonine protein kinase
VPLSSGDRLGPYEIVAPLGEGGMGEVDKANDTRLDRFVAVKVLPERFAKGPGGITGMSTVTMSPDAKTFAFNYRRRISELFLVEGLN